MATILGVHGIAQQYRGGPELTRGWFDAIRGGLEVAGERTKADSLSERNVRVAFFGDLFRPEGSKGGGEPPFEPKHLQDPQERELLELWYQEAVAQDPSLGPPSGAKAPGAIAIQVLLKRLLRSRTFAGAAQRAFIGNLKQVTAFLESAEDKERALLRVDAEVTAETRVIVGHSLGSVVAYEYLARFAPDHVRLFVTLGSPLGISNLVFDRLSPRPVRGVGTWPGNIPDWVNVADKNDVVALRKTLAPLFPAGRNAIADYAVDNGDEPHAISRYLNARVTGEALAAVL